MICVVCGLPLNTRQRMYCSNACKQQGYRNRSQSHKTPGRSSIMGVSGSASPKLGRTRDDALNGNGDALPKKYRRTVTDAFYIELVYELALLAQRGGTASGAAVVARRVARKHNIRAAEWVGLPRLTRAERESLLWSDRNRDQSIS